MLALLRQRTFALLWFGGLISLVGDWILLTALPFYVYERTGSTLATAAMTSASLLPTVVLGSVAGVLVDRWNRKAVLLGANVCQMIVVLLLLALAWNEHVWIVYVVALFQSVCRAFAIPAEQALLPQVVATQHLLAANALNGLNNQLARLIGPPLGGVVLAAFGLNAIILTDSLSFAGAAILLVWVTLPDRSQATSIRETTSPARGTVFWRAWCEGITAIHTDRTMAMLLLVIGVSTFGGTMIDPLYPAFAHDVIHMGSAGFGLLLTSQAIGGVLGGMVLGRVGRILPAARMLGWGNIVIGGLLVVQCQSPYVSFALGTAFLVGPAQIAVGAALQTLLQQRVPDAMRGRVIGALGTIGALLSIAGSGVGGQLGAAWGIVPGLTLAALLTIIAGVVALRVLPEAA